MSSQMLLRCCTALVAVIVGLAVVGAILSYSPVPYWDMWDGALYFFMQVQDGDHAAWWAQHNEHHWKDQGNSLTKCSDPRGGLWIGG